MRPRTLSALLAVCLLAVSGAAQEPGKNDPATAATQVVELVNQLREKAKLKAVAVNPKLTAVAQKHAEDMARQGKLSHVSDGLKPSKRVHREGYAARRVAEIVTLARGGSGAAAAAVRNWLKSPNHSKIIHLDAVTQTGVGVAADKSGRWYFCQIFATPR